MTAKNRYNKGHSYGDVRFYLADFMPTEEQCRYMMLKVLEQAVRDYCSLANSEIASDHETWLLAKEFLFDEEYRIMWGDLELSTEDYLDIIDLDIRWVREQTIKRFNRRNK